MRRTLVWLLLVLALGVAAVLFVTLPDIDAPEAEQPHAAPASVARTEAGTRRRSVPVPDAAPRAPESAAAAPHGRLESGLPKFAPDVIVVRVLRADGTPAAGVRVATIVPARRAVEPTEKTTDADGRATFSELEVSGAEAFLAWTQTESAVVARSGQAAETLRLAPGVRVSGRVEAQDGTPIDGALCTLVWPGDTTIPALPEPESSDGHGNVAFPGLPVPDGAEPIRVAVRAEGYAPQTVAADARGIFLARLRAPPAITGRCVDESGSAIAGVQIWVMGDDWWREGASGPDGSFRVGPVPQLEATVTFDAADREPRALRTAPGDDDTPLGDVVLARGAAIRGVVADTSGRRLPGVQIEARSVDEGGWRRSGVSGTDGAFEILGLPARGAVPLFAEVPTLGARGWFSAGTATPGSVDVRIDVAAERLVIVRVVHEPAGTPARAAMFTVTSGDGAHTVMVVRRVELDTFVVRLPVSGAQTITVTSHQQKWVSTGTSAAVDVLSTGTVDAEVRVRRVEPRRR